MSALRTWLAGAIVVGLSVAGSTARAEPLPYRGPHPVDYEGRWHFERDVHVHDELPVGTEPFAAVEGVLVFLGDPVGFAYDGDVWTYDGAHPLPFGMKGYCGLSGEHRHPFAPEGEYRRDGGVYDYVGAMRGGVGTYRPGRVEVPRSVRREREDRAEEATPAVYYGFTPVVPVGPHHRVHPQRRVHRNHGKGRHPARWRRQLRQRGRWHIREPQCTALTNPRAVVFDGCPPAVRSQPRTRPRREPRPHGNPPRGSRRERSQEPGGR